MAPWTSKDASAHPQEEGLSDLLTIEQRSELTVLIANITEVMRKQIDDIFDTTISVTKEPAQALHMTDKNPNLDDGKAPKDISEEDKARQLKEKNAKELPDAKLQDLKKDALTYFHQWQEEVVSRVGEVVNTKETAETQINAAVSTTTPDTAPPPDNKVVTANTNREDADAALIEHFPPTSTSLCSLPKDKRSLILHSVLLLLLSLEHYNAHSRVLLLHVSSSLHLPLFFLAEDEVRIAQGLVEAAKHMTGDEETKKRSDDNKVARRWKVGVAGVAGAALIGITGGLAAPLVAAGVGAVMGGLGLGATAAAGMLGAVAESGIIVGALFGAYGGRMTGKMMDAYAKEVEDFAFLPLRGSKRAWHSANEAKSEDRRLRVSIGISGWLTQKEDIITPWRVLGHQSEIFALRWELEALMKLGSSMETVVKSAAWTVAKKEIIARTIFASLLEALWPIAILKVSKIVDNPFSVGMSRADKAGLVLADALINKAQGERPVTLIGYSLGARLIYSCLMSLAERRAFGLVEAVVLIGTPAPSDESRWQVLRSVVSGRLVNVYSENDYILAFLYRTSAIQLGVAGLQKAQVKGVENVDVSSMVSGHLRYQYLTGTILEKIGWEDVDVDEVAKEEETLALMEEQEEKERAKKGEKGEDADEEAVTQGKVTDDKQQTLLQKGLGKLHLG